MDEQSMNWRDKSDVDMHRYFKYSFEDEDFMPILPPTHFEVRILDVKEYDFMLTNKKDLGVREPYIFYEGDLNEVADVSKNVRQERLSPELNLLNTDVPDGAFLLVPDKIYRVYFDMSTVLKDTDSMTFDFVPSAKALNYGFMFQSPAEIREDFNPVFPIYGDEKGYVFSTNMITPVGVVLQQGNVLGRIYLRD